MLPKGPHSAEMKKFKIKYEKRILAFAVEVEGTQTESEAFMVKLGKVIAKDTNLKKQLKHSYPVIYYHDDDYNEEVEFDCDCPLMPVSSKDYELKFLLTASSPQKANLIQVSLVRAFYGGSRSTSVIIFFDYKVVQL